MSIDVLQACSIGFCVAAGVLFLTAVALFFLMDIPKLYGEISGKTAQKAIEQIKKHNAEAMTGEVTVRHTGNGVRTEKFATATLAAEAEAGATTVLADAGATTVLEETGATTVLGDAGATTMLTEAEHKQETGTGTQTPEIMDEFVLEKELSYAESAEIIE